MAKYCSNCGEPLPERAYICVKCGVKVEDNFNTNNQVNPKSKLAAGLFGIFLGSIGVHNFYLGYNNKAIAQVLITVISCGAFSFVSGIWGLIEGILILTGNINKDGKGNPLID